MKKIQLTGLALATLAACAPAWAQSTVTIYGAVDMAVGKDFQVDALQIRPGKTGLQSRWKHLVLAPAENPLAAHHQGLPHL